MLDLDLKAEVVETAMAQRGCRLFSRSSPRDALPCVRLCLRSAPETTVPGEEDEEEQEEQEEEEEEEEEEEVAVLETGSGSWRRPSGRATDLPVLTQPGLGVTTTTITISTGLL